MIENADMEVHHRVPRSLLSLHDRVTACEELDGATLQSWRDFEEECQRSGMSPDLAREKLEAAIEASTVEVTREKHRETIHAADWLRWGRMGGLRVLELYGAAYFGHLARRRWNRISAHDLACVRERLRRSRKTMG